MHYHIGKGKAFHFPSLESVPFPAMVDPAWVLCPSSSVCLRLPLRVAFYTSAREWSLCCVCLGWVISRKFQGNSWKFRGGALHLVTESSRKWITSLCSQIIRNTVPCVCFAVLNNPSYFSWPFTIFRNWREDCMCVCARTGEVLIHFTAGSAWMCGTKGGREGLLTQAENWKKLERKRRGSGFLVATADMINSKKEGM